MPDETFKPNALLVLERERPVIVVFFRMLLLHVKTSIIVSSIGLKWNSVTDERLRSDYHEFMDCLLEKLPSHRKYLGGFFTAQVHEDSKLAPWEVNEKSFLSQSLHASKQPDDICIKEATITIDGYVGEDLRCAISNMFKPRNSRANAVGA